MKKELGEGYKFLPEKGSSSLFSKNTRYILYGALILFMVWEFRSSDSGYQSLFSLLFLVIPFTVRYFFGFGSSILDSGYPQFFYNGGKIIFFTGKFFAAKKNFIVCRPADIVSVRMGQRQGYMNFWIIQAELAGGKKVNMIFPDSEKLKFERLLNFRQ